MRPPTLDDLDSVTRLINACEVAEYGQPDTMRDEIRSAWQSQDFKLETDAWVVLSADGQMVGIAETGHTRHAHVYFDVHVHPDYLGRGIGTYLLHLAETRGKQHVSEAEPGVRVTLFTGTGSVNTEAQQLLEKHGFKLVRHFWRMGIELKETPPRPQGAENITVRTFAPGMERAVFEATEEAFQDHWGHMPRSFEEWEQQRIQREGFDPSWWFLAMDGDEIAGVSLCKERGASGGWVSTLGVRRRWRRKGLGLALLYHTFGEFYRRGIRKVALGVDAQSLTGATRLYERAGMHVERQFNDYEKELRAGRELSTQSIEV